MDPSARTPSAMWTALLRTTPLVTHLDPQGVEEHDRVDRFQRPGLPGGDLVEHRVGHRADQVGRDLDPVELAQVGDDLPGAHAAGVHRHDLVVEAEKAALVAGDQLRVERRLPVARDRQFDPAGLGRDCLTTVAIARVAGLLARQMMVHLGVEGALGQGLLQLVQQAVSLERRLRISAGQQLV